MGKNDVMNVLNQFRSALESKGVRVSRLVLFGSWADNTARESSDIDVAVVSQDFDGKDHWKRSTMLGAAVYKVFAPIQAVAFTPDEWESGDSMLCSFARTGEVILA
ncbi:MAG: nucleotidyltransferase domain-containing protein [Candidatus Omnitrophica bacterium]|nr:nucleotidyltransferase domain-containing protein [Candidatus Omnitrophota bacterium]